MVAPKSLTVDQKLAALGIDVICERMAGGESQRSIARSAGVSIASLCQWFAACSKRSARAREGRAQSAMHWDEEADTVLRNADVDTPGAVAIARERASHFRWRARVYNPRDYGERTIVAGDAENPVHVVSKFVADADDLVKKIRGGK
jgi:hypothetical protein